MSITPPMWRNKADSKGYKPDLNLIGNRYVHVKGGVYRIMGFMWDAEFDLWKIEYQRENKSEDDSDRYMRFTRSPENFFGKHESGETRFRQMEPEAPKTTFRSRSVSQVLVEAHDDPHEAVGQYRG